MKTKEMIAVMQAFIDGEEIQCKRLGSSESDWFNYSNGNKPAWNWSDFEYRVKPRSRYLNVYANHPVVTSWKPSLEEAERVRHRMCIGYLEDKQDGSVPVFHLLKS